MLKLRLNVGKPKGHTFVINGKVANIAAGGKETVFVKLGQNLQQKKFVSKDGVTATVWKDVRFEF